MKTRAAILALAVGVFVLALWLVFRPGESRLADKITPILPSSGPAPIAGESPTKAPDQTGTPPPAVSMAGTKASSAASAPVHGTVAVQTYAPGVSPAPGNGAEVTVAGGRSPAASRDPQIDAGKVRVMLRDYHTLAGENPVGTNAEIMSALIGGNARQATLGPPEGMPLNAKGELVDQWDTPYFFHQLSKDVTEVRSAGPDKVLWTADDVVAK